MITATIAMTGILALAIAAPAQSGAILPLTILALAVVIGYGLYENACRRGDDQ